MIKKMILSQFIRFLMRRIKNQGISGRDKFSHRRFVATPSRLQITVISNTALIQHNRQIGDRGLLRKTGLFNGIG
ncbi:Putative phage protein [Xenorhabdus bovienii]|uniref:Putative phage protein n=1 Tax=Xenorhabdus bovienii TaxID=40576 RepID=A0A0B6XF07_XENBV|nr:Putative phage protein [Xenorhabdus bovienii]